MKNNLYNVVFFLLILSNLMGCSKKISRPSTEIVENDNVNNESIQIIEETIQIVKSSVEQKNITDFFFNEIMNGNMDLSFRNEADGIINFFGEPLEENRIPSSFYFEGGTVIEIHELIYEDLTHRYIVFESRRELYSGFLITKKLDRLKSINIGDTSEKLLSTFSDKYYTWDEIESIKENISYYTNPVYCEIRFEIKDAIIQTIFCNFLLI